MAKDRTYTLDREQTNSTEPYNKTTKTHSQDTKEDNTKTKPTYSWGSSQDKIKRTSKGILGKRLIAMY